ncbi:SRPBCC family protein [Saccharomonospora xinjiangensis]|uniref:Polyketide cyclase / dehydrase and lipid transport n=1 Tax=Saccharomonospora xinjiangensis XJ-54 TaxID=882086 RepID=I0V462_9PSEU|nr:SRPBCC family protein [Saccharomonospora xinjiangensis]EID54915.1 Polyketide cyclase / dehydrase and lipid transport [Saccharomonospora xinjiangensis XJ-54]
METACDIVVRAGSDRVWELVTDIELSIRFSPELQRVTWLGGATGPKLGARFEGHNRSDAVGEWRTESHVVAFEPPKTFAWAVVDPDGRFGDTETDPAKPMATWRFDLTPHEDGVLLRQGVRLGPARSGLSKFIDAMPDKRDAIIAYRLADLRTSMEATLRGIKELAESRGALVTPAKRLGPVPHPSGPVHTDREAGSLLRALRDEENH